MMEEKSIPTSNLLLDPNNFRFQDLEGFVYASEERFGEDTVQSRTMQKIRQEEGVQELKASILRNGYVPIERIVVRPYKDKWLVIEGNRRVAAAKWILDDVEAGFELSPHILDTLKNLPAVVVEEAGEDPIFRASLMGIRHVSGIKQWGGYQRAKLVAHMRDELDLEPGEVAERLGMQAQEVNRRYRAYKALQQMQEHEEFGDAAKPSMYPIFHEAVSIPVVRGWLQWNQEETRFGNEETLFQFYELITEHEDEEGMKREPKITSYSQVRELRLILEKPEAKSLLLDPTRSFQEAVTVARQDELSGRWLTEVSEAISALESMEIKELKELKEEDVQILKKLKSVAEERLSDYVTLNPAKHS